MKDWVADYLDQHKKAIDSIPADAVAELIELLKSAMQEDRRIFVFGNGGSASNASHFATDLGKSASDAVGRPFNVLSLNDNVSWITAIGNDYDYRDIFMRQLANYAKPGDVALTFSVSGSSLNLVRAYEWAREHGLKTVAVIGGKRGKLAEIAEHVVVIESTHYGRVEDCQMTIAHMLCYAFVERPEYAD